MDCDWVGACGHLPAARTLAGMQLSVGHVNITFLFI
jgi:hypothetical protein